MRIGVFADVNLNLVDGSSVWVQSFAEAVGRYTSHEVVVISRNILDVARPIPRALRRSRITYLTPEELTGGAGGGIVSLFTSPVFAALKLDAMLVRGVRASQTLLEIDLPVRKRWAYITEFTRQTAWDENKLRALKSINAEYDNLLLQTEEARQWFALLPDVDVSGTALLPPMIPAHMAARDKAVGHDRHYDVIYAGKFAPEWGIDALRGAVDAGDAWERVKAVVFGDKIHNPPDDPDFHPRTQGFLESSLVDWRGGVSREAVFNALRETDFCWAWREPSLEDDTLELSSKLLEACAAGAAPICYPNSQNRNLLGDDYPFFARTSEEAREFLAARELNRERLKEVRDQLKPLAEANLDRTVIRNILGQLIPPRKALSHDGSSPPSITEQSRPPRLKLAGHDLKFATHLVWSLKGDFDVIQDIWRGHDEPQRHQQEAADDADIIWAEWCLGNAVYYSRNKLPHQKLVIRFHRQEFRTAYPQQVDMQNVHAIVFVNDHDRRIAADKYNWPLDKLVCIPNYVAPNAFFLPKTEDAYFNLGMVGCVPAMKRLDRALDLLETLRKADDRWTLWVKGHKPDEYPWMKDRPEELEYYEQLRIRVAGSDYLRGAVNHAAAGKDVPQFLSRIGWVLSPSDFESFHLAIVEGAAAGAVPVVWNWDAAESIYGTDWIVTSTMEAAERIQRTSRKEWRQEAHRARKFVLGRFGVDRVSEQMRQLLLIN